jgi:outer membrane protein assembly factor BamB
MNGRRAPSRRSVLRSLAAGGVVGLAGCQCAAAPTTRRLEVAVSDGPRETDDGWVLDVAVELTLRNVGDEPFGTANLRMYDADQSSVGTVPLGPFEESAGYAVGSRDTCGGKEYTYTRTLTVRANGEPTYLNPYVPESACSDLQTGHRNELYPVVRSSEWSPQFRCGQQFPFRVLDVEDAPAGDGADWPMPGFDAARSAHNPEGSGPPAPSGGRWTAAVGDKAPPPVVESGAVYVVPDGLVEDTSDPEFEERTVVALSLETGELAWRGQDATHAVSVADGRVYGSGDALFALAAATGRERWSVDLPVDAATPPTVANGQVYVADDGGTVRAYGAEDGDEGWTAAVGEVRAPLAAGDDAVYAVADGTVTALAADAGDTRWETTLEGADGGAQVGEGTVYVPVAGEAVALSAGDGSERWRVDASTTGAVGAVGDGTVYLPDDDSVLAVAAGDGSVRWRAALDSFTEVRALVGDRVYAASDGALVVLDAATGDRLGTFGDGVDVDHPVVAGDAVLHVTHEGLLRVLDGG